MLLFWMILFVSSRVLCLEDNFELKKKIFIYIRQAEIALLKDGFL